MKVKKRTFGVLSNGRKASIFTVSNKSMSFSVTNYGCAITSINVPDRNGKDGDIVLGYPTLEGYIDNPVFLGCIVGRFANRIAGSRFSLDGKEYTLDANENGNCLHSGPHGYHRVLWRAEPFCTRKEAGVVFHHKSASGDQGFPGELVLKIRYTLTSNNDIILSYSAITDEPTPVNLTNHTYFNLGGHDSGSVLNQTVQLFADRYVPVDGNSIPTGELNDVAGTPFDFRSPKEIGAEIAAVPGGYDHNWVINKAGDMPNPVAGVFDPVSGRAMTVYSTQPGVQFYTGNFLSDVKGKFGACYGKHGALCLETQHFPDSPNQPGFPDSVLLPGDRYRHETIWHFDF